MNFFEAQHNARSNTFKIILLFLVAVIAIDISLYLLAHWSLKGVPPNLESIDYSLLINISLALLALISIGSLYKMSVLASGGGVGVAESMGGHLINPGTRNHKERQLLNIVEEMAIASGISPPPVYLIPDPSINAFAAGSKINSAVIGITQGSIDNFSREEMQGVIAHEFSHIIHGDMSLNMRLTGIIHGIMLLSILGYFILRASIFSSFASRRRDGAALALPLIGLALTALGFIGAFFGKWIRAAVSRQREFLADASAVQFTRNPNGIGSALQKIGVKTGLLSSPNTMEYAHMFFAEGLRQKFLAIMSTHPPLEERIARVLPQWDGESILYNEAEISADSAPASDSTPVKSQLHADNATGLTGLHQVASNGDSTSLNPAPEPAKKLPPDLFALLFNKKTKVHNISDQVGSLQEPSLAAAKSIVNSVAKNIDAALHDSYSARALVYAILLDRQPNSSYLANQLQQIEQYADTGVHPLTVKLAPEVTKLPEGVCLMLVLRAIPALRMMSADQYKRFAQIISGLIEADTQTTLFEWATESVLLHYLDNQFKATNKTALPTSKIASEYALSVMSRIGQDNPQQALEAFNAAKMTFAKSLQFNSDDIQPNRLYSALCKLNQLSWKDKKAFLEAVCICATLDGYVNANENVLIHAYAALLDCPMPLIIE